MDLIKLVLAVLIIAVIIIIFFMTFLDILKERRSSYHVEEDFLKDFNEYVEEEIIREAKAPVVSEASLKELEEAKKLVRKTLQEKQELEREITELKYVSERREKDQAKAVLKDIHEELEKTLEHELSFKDKVKKLDEKEVEYFEFKEEPVKEEIKIEEPIKEEVIIEEPEVETIISLDEFEKKGSQLYEANEKTQYDLDETIPISIDELYDTMKIPVVDLNAIENLEVTSTLKVIDKATLVKDEELNKKKKRSI